VVWDRTPWQMSGLLQLASGGCALVIGAYLGPAVLRRRQAVRLLAGIALAIALIELAVCLAQVAGIPINQLDTTATGDLGSRVNGTLNHPNNLGKAMLLLIVLGLALMASSDKRTRTTATLTVIVAFVPLAMGQGRAAIAAALLTVLFWAMIAPRSGAPAWSRIAIPLTVATLFLPFLGEVSARIASDPEGGARSELRAAALAQIERSPLTGTGPNSFVEVVRDYSSAVAEGPGYPVHNAFLLTAAELGIVGAVLFWLGIGLVIWRAWQSRREPGLSSGFGLAIVAATPGWYVIDSTGWGMLGGSLLPLWFLILGLGYSQFPRRADRRTAAAATSSVLRRHRTTPRDAPS
jgi:O-antigen ligase